MTQYFHQVPSLWDTNHPTIFGWSISPKYKKGTFKLVQRQHDFCIFGLLLSLEVPSDLQTSHFKISSYTWHAQLGIILRHYSFKCSSLNFSLLSLNPPLKKSHQWSRGGPTCIVVLKSSPSWILKQWDNRWSTFSKWTPNLDWSQEC